MFKDDKKIVKDFVEDIFGYVVHNYITKGHYAFRYEIPSTDRLSYIVYDKGIDRRLQKMFKKRLNVNSTVTYKWESSTERYPTGVLQIELMSLVF